MRTYMVLPIATAALSESPAHAGDQRAQVALQRLNWVPARIETTQLAARMTAYEGTCKGAERVVTIICVGDECRVQTKAKEEEPYRREW